MSLFIYPTNSVLRSPERIRELEINLTYKLSKLDFDSIIQRILIDFCNINVLGYDKGEDKYWCKKYNNSSCILQLEIKVISKGCDYSNIKIMPLIGEEDVINLFVMDFNESVQIYKTSNFIKSVLCKYWFFK